MCIRDRGETECFYKDHRFCGRSLSAGDTGIIRRRYGKSPVGVARSHEGDIQQFPDVLPVEFICRRRLLFSAHDPGSVSYTHLNN